MSKHEGTTPCGPEHVYVCSACGKTSRTRYGFNASNQNVCDRGWDESCAMHAVLCYAKKSTNGEWMAV